MTTSIANPTTATFDAEVLQREGTVLVDFWAPWCGPCNALKPVVQAVLGLRDTGVQGAFVNVDESPELAQRYGVTSIPALKLFRDGELVAERTGALPKADLEAWLDEHGA